jgi:hypothetical protein
VIQEELTGPEGGARDPLCKASLRLAQSALPRGAARVPKAGVRGCCLLRLPRGHPQYALPRGRRPPDSPTVVAKAHCPRRSGFLVPEIVHSANVDDPLDRDPEVGRRVPPHLSSLCYHLVILPPESLSFRVMPLGQHKKTRRRHLGQALPSYCGTAPAPRNQVVAILCLLRLQENTIDGVHCGGGGCSNLS